jgi:hypothetical protein
LCKDEFVEHGHFSPQLYVREGRRMKGQYVVSQKDILKEPAKDDPIVISSFPIDSHDCRRIATKDGVVNEGTIFPVKVKGIRQGFAYHIPYRAILPKEEECTNLLVPVALSCTHVAISSIRVEPTWMILGQSAGIAAALSVKEGSTVQKLSYEKLKPRLEAQGQVLELPAQTMYGMSVESLGGIVLDDSAAEKEGKWSASKNFDQYVGEGYHFAEKDGGLTKAVFRFTVPKSGRYEIRMAYSPHETRATNVPVKVESGGVVQEFTFDQTLGLPGDSPFRKVGEVLLSADKETVVMISNRGVDGFVILDAIHLIEPKD